MSANWPLSPWRSNYCVSALRPGSSLSLIAHWGLQVKFWHKKGVWGDWGGQVSQLLSELCPIIQTRQREALDEKLQNWGFYSVLTNLKGWVLTLCNITDEELQHEQLWDWLWAACRGCVIWDLTLARLAGACAGCYESQDRQGTPLLKNVAIAGNRETSSGQKRGKMSRSPWT